MDPVMALLKSTKKLQQCNRCIVTSVHVPLDDCGSSCQSRTGKSDRSGQTRQRLMIFFIMCILSIDSVLNTQNAAVRLQSQYYCCQCHTSALSHPFCPLFTSTTTTVQRQIILSLEFLLEWQSQFLFGYNNTSLAPKTNDSQI